MRLMSGPDPDDPGASIAVVERLLHLVCHQTEINELSTTASPSRSREPDR